MKKCLVLVLFFAAAQLAVADETITVRKSDLPADVVSKLERDQNVQAITANLKTAQEWSGMGKEIGVAVNEGLKAVTTQTAEFSKTDVGRFTMFIIAWKVMFKDIMDVSSSLVGILVGVSLLLFVNSFAVWVFRRMFVGGNAVKSRKGSLWQRQVEYEPIPSFVDDWSVNDKASVLLGYWIILVVINGLIIVACL